MKFFKYSTITVRELALRLASNDGFERWMLEQLNSVGASGNTRVVNVERFEEPSDVLLGGVKTPYIGLTFLVEREVDE